MNESVDFATPNRRLDEPKKKKKNKNNKKEVKLSPGILQPSENSREKSRDNEIYENVWEFSRTVERVLRRVLI